MFNSKLYYQKNIEKFKEYYQKNIKKIKEKKRTYYQKNKEVIKAKRAKYGNTWAKNNPEKVLAIMKRHFEKYGKTFEMNGNEFIYALNSWSATIKNLDNHMCKNCDSKKNIQAHHLRPKNDFPKLCLGLDNGITLCKKCHEEIHGFRSYNKQTLIL